MDRHRKQQQQHHQQQQQKKKQKKNTAPAFVVRGESVPFRKLGAPKKKLGYWVLLGFTGFLPSF